MNTMIEYNVFTIDNGLQSLCKSEACTKIKGIPDCRPQIRSLETKGEPVVWVSFEEEGLFLWVFKEEGGRLGDGMGVVLYIPAGFRNCVPELWKGVKDLVKDSVTRQEEWEALLSDARQHGPEEAIPFGDSRKDGGFAYVSIGSNPYHYTEKELSERIDQKVYYEYEAVFFLTKGQTVKSQAGMSWKAENALILKDVSYVKPPKRTENYVPMWEGRPLRESWKRYIDKLSKKAEYVRWEREHWKTIERTFELKPGIVEVPSLDAKEEEKKLLIPRSVFTVGPNCELKINGCEFVKECPVELKEGVDAEIVASGSRYGECKASKSFAEMQDIVENGKTINLRWSYEIILSEAELHQLFPGDFATQGVQCTFSVKEGQYSKEEFRARLTRLFGRASRPSYPDNPSETPLNRPIDDQKEVESNREKAVKEKSLSRRAHNGKKKPSIDSEEFVLPKPTGGKKGRKKGIRRKFRTILFGSIGIVCLAVVAAVLCFVRPGGGWFSEKPDYPMREMPDVVANNNTEGKGFEKDLLAFAQTEHTVKEVEQWFQQNAPNWRKLKNASMISDLLSLCDSVDSTLKLTAYPDAKATKNVVDGWRGRLRDMKKQQQQKLIGLLKEEKWHAVDFEKNSIANKWYNAFNTYNVDGMKRLLDSISLTDFPDLKQIRNLLNDSNVCKEMKKRKLYDPDGSKGSITISWYLKTLKKMQSSSGSSAGRSAQSSEKRKDVQGSMR